MSRTVFGLLVVLAMMLLFAGSAQAQLQDFDDDSRENARRMGLLPIWDDDDDDGDDGGFGRNFGGSWLGQGSFSVDLGCDGVFDILDIPINDAHTFGFGGGHVATNPANPNSGHGTWKKTGPRQVSLRDINFGVDATPNGNLTSISIISMVVNFDHGFKTATTMFSAKVYAPTADPLDPGAVPFACTEGQHYSFRKVSATE